MGRSDSVCESEQFYCYSLSQSTDRDTRDIESFQPIDEGGIGLVRYLQRMAFADERNGDMRTYLVRDKETEELVGYFSLKAGLVSIDESDSVGRGSFDTMPAVELANYAINGNYRDAHPSSRGCGKVIFRELILTVARMAAGYIGIHLLYIYSLPIRQVMENYAGYGFVRLPEEDEALLHSRLKPRYDAQCVFMYMVL